MPEQRLQPWIELDARKAAILQAIVKDYVETAEPVGSEGLVQKYPLGVKPATVRNEMAVMSEWGYLYQPHTSAGRVPSDLGYRYYIERLFVPNKAVRFDRFAWRLNRGGESLPEMLMATLRLLSDLTRYAAFATTARDQHLKLVRCVITPLGKERVLLVCAFDNGYVETRMVELGVSLSGGELRRMQNSLGRALEEQRADHVLRLKGSTLSPFQKPAPREAFERVLKAVQSATREASRGELYYEGLLHMIEQPEFQKQLQLLEQVLRILDEKKRVYDTLEANCTEGITVLIGRENPMQELQHCTVVFARYHTGTREGGIVGVLGPTRMNYDQTLPTVQHMACGLSQVLTHLLQL